MLFDTILTYIDELFNNFSLLHSKCISCFLKFQIAVDGLAGDPKNRWFDKYSSAITYKNGMMASNCDVGKAYLL